jgi:hypothetical protein
MIEYEYEVRFYLETTSITTIVYVDRDYSNVAIAKAENNLAYEGIDLSKLTINEVIATKTGELH